MATHAAIAAVSRTLRTVLLDRMVMPVSVTLAPPDVTVAGIDGARVNLYLIQLIENANLKNQEIPGKGSPAAYGHPPLSLNLRYLMTTHSAIETQPDADLNAQTLLGDAMRVFNDFGNRVDQLAIVNPAAGTVGDPLLDPVLADEFERVKIVLHPASLDDITKVWSAVSGTNFRRSVVYEVTVIQIETIEPRVRPQPVETRRIFMTVRRRPEILDAYVTPALNGPIGEIRARIGDEITILSEGALADRLYVRLGMLDPIRVSPTADGRIRIALPDAQYPADLDNPLPRPIPPQQRLQPGPLEVQVIAGHPIEGVEGGLGHGAAIAGTRRYSSNLAMLQLCPTVTSVVPVAGNATTVLRVNGQRLWHARARVAEVIVGDAAIAVRAPAAGDPWAAPTPTAVEVPMSAAMDILVVSPTPYLVAMQVDGARSRDPGISFTLGP
ncbi:DUF4255 domain-containing protein [Mesorhizobium sp. LjNodule214]|uniref:DUF4255 domain-containing protein n=1 Tax=Mesorhizobium sp. LjNodule214 TaxID=3342252 RepID=UPI003ED01225